MVTKMTEESMYGLCERVMGVKSVMAEDVWKNTNCADPPYGEGLLFILVSTTFLTLCRGDCFSRASDLNPRWRQVDVMEKYAHKYLQHLPVLYEDTCDKRKHFVAIFSQALVEYAASNITDHSSAVKEAAHNTKKLIDKPSNDVASKLRSVISIILSIVDQPITDIQTVCSYKVREKECSLALSSLQEGRFKRCPHYSKNLAIFNGFRDLTNNCDFKQFFDNMLLESSFAEPCEAIDFFTESAAVKYSSIFQLFKSLFKNMTRQPMPCKAMFFY